MTSNKMQNNHANKSGISTSASVCDLSKNHNAVKQATITGGMTTRMTENSLMHWEKDNSHMLASERNMHAVNDRNLRRSVTKLKIKLQEKMKNLK